MRRQRLDEAPIPYMFQAGVIPQMDIAVRTSGNPEALTGAIRAQMEALDPGAPPYGIITVEQRLSQSVALRRFQTLLLAALAAVALVLALVGAYSIIHRSVASRTQEIGIRSALGASASTISTMVLASGLSLGVVGLGIGLVGIRGAQSCRVVVPLRDEPVRSAHVPGGDDPDVRRDHGGDADAGASSCADRSDGGTARSIAFVGV